MIKFIITVVSHIMNFKDITLKNLKEVSDLLVAPSQTSFVADNCFSIAQVGLKSGSWCRGVYFDSTPVGFYKKCGFVPTEECINGEWKMVHTREHIA